jgi:hypothetical protein
MIDRRKFPKGFLLDVLENRLRLQVWLVSLHLIQLLITSLGTVSMSMVVLRLELERIHVSYKYYSIRRMDLE